MTEAALNQTAAIIASNRGMPHLDAVEVLTKLGLDDADLQYLATYPDQLGAWIDDSTSNRVAGATGWVVWFADSDTARAINGGDPAHIEHVGSLDEALAAASGRRTMMSNSSHDDRDATSLPLLGIVGSAALRRWEGCGYEISAEVLDIVRGCSSAGVDLDEIDMEALSEAVATLHALRSDNTLAVLPRSLWNSLYSLVRIGPASNNARIRWRGQVSDILRVLGFDLLPVARTDADVLESALAMMIDQLDTALDAATRPGRRKNIAREIDRAKRLLKEIVTVREVVS